MNQDSSRTKPRRSWSIETWWQMKNWLDRVERIALGIEHFREPRFHRGQWVRFIGDSGSVQSNARPPAPGEYGQVLHFLYGRRNRGGLTVLFIGRKAPANMCVEFLEPLVGVPVGQPRDHLRNFQRRMAGHLRKVQMAERETT